MVAQERGLAAVQPQAMQVGYAGPPAIDWREVERLVNEVLWRGLSPEQREILLVWARRFDLDPVAMEVVSISGKPFVTLAGLLKVAERSGKYDGASATAELVTRRIEQGKEVQQYVATATVWHRDRSHPVVMSARQWEHENPKSMPWQKSPAAMTEKCALARALRLSFSLTGLTVAEEVGYDEESTETNAGKVLVMGVGQAEMARSRAKEIGDGGQGQSRDVPAAGADVPGDGREPLGWTEFWDWAKKNGYKSRADLDAALGRPTSGMVPDEIARALLARREPSAVQAVPEAPQTTREYTLAEKGDLLIAWLAKQPRTQEQQFEKVERLFGLTEDQQVLETWRALVTEHVHQDTRDLAWFNRMEALGRLHVINQQPIEGESVQAEMPSGEPGDDVPF